MKYKYRIVYKSTMKPFKVPSGVYEIPAEEVIVDTFQEAVDFTRNRPDLTYEFIFEKIEPESFNPETVCVFVKRPTHTMKVGDLIWQECDGEFSVVEVVKIGEIENTYTNKEIQRLRKLLSNAYIELQQLKRGYNEFISKSGTK